MGADFLKLPLAASVLLVCAAALHSQSITAEKLRWKGGAKAAYTYIHDDLCDPSTPGIFKYADPEAKKRGLVFGSGAIVENCSDKWKQLNQMVADGDEIVSHSWTHADARKGWNVQKEII